MSIRKLNYCTFLCNCHLDVTIAYNDLLSYTCKMRKLIIHQCTSVSVTFITSTDASEVDTV